MAALKPTRGLQYPLVAEFTFDIANDTATNTSGVSDGFSALATHVFDIINLPVNAVVTGGAVATETAVTGSTAYDVSIGDSGNATRYLGVTDRTAVGSTPLVPTGYLGAGEQIRLTVTPTIAASTGGKITVRVEYVIRNRTNEVQPV